MKDKSLNFGCGPSIITLFVLILVTILGNTGNPDLAHKILNIYMWLYGICISLGAIAAGIYGGIMMIGNTRTKKQLIYTGIIGFLIGFFVIGIPSALIGCIIYYVGNNICL